MPSRFHRSIGRERPDTRADVEHRLAGNAARAQLALERRSRFPTITSDNAAEVIAWQEARLAELMAPIDAAWRRTKK